MTPRILVIDDLYGRNTSDGRNIDRDNICAHFRWQDVTGDEACSNSTQNVIEPVAEVVFCRGQTPTSSNVGDKVENNIALIIEIVRKGWILNHDINYPPMWSMVLIDLCFYTGRVTDESDKYTSGMPEGRTSDDNPESYFGLVVLEVIRQHFPELPCMILSSKPRDDVSLEFSRLGAVGFVARDDPDAPNLVLNAIHEHGLMSDGGEVLVGRSMSILLALREARRAARHRGNLLIRGERGSGKELLADYAHRSVDDYQGQVKRPFVAVNSAVLRTDLFASELFGIEPKTASGVDGKIGLVEAADGGDLFLDEIADLPPDAQASVLRVLQDCIVTRLGGRKPKVVDVRFISATNAELENKNSGFRKDLLDRLRIGGTLWLPPLRERMEDIPLLAEKFLRDAVNQRAGAIHREITPDSIERLMEYNWPGNVRELRACVFDAVFRNPNVEYLVPGHIKLEEGNGFRVVSGSRVEKSVSEENFVLLPPSDNISDKAPKVTNTLEILKSTQSSAYFDVRDVAHWAGQFDELHIAHHKMLARYLLAALEATKKRSPEVPEGLIQIHPAVKLMKGDSDITATKAADVIKRILGPLEDCVDGDLKEALRIALRLRPKSAKTRRMQRGA